jgi:hypothetical protein
VSSAKVTSWLALGAAFVVTACLVVLDSQGRGAAVSQVPAGVDVPITVAGGLGTDNGARPIVEVRVGGGPLMPVLLDTGSTGLAIDQSALEQRSGQAGMTMTGRHVSREFADGEVESGVIASAPITIGGVPTTRSVPFLLVQSRGCDPSRPACPRNGLAPGAAVDGVLGASLSPADDGTENPLLRLPPPYSHSWSIKLEADGGDLILGARPPGRDSLSFQLPRARASSQSQSGFDDTRAPVCWRVAFVKRCLPTQFDTGSNFMVWLSPAWARFAGKSPYLPPGQFVSAYRPGATKAFWTFVAG